MPDERHEISIEDRRYPDSVKDLHDPPRKLYVRGNPEILKTPSLSIIGARSATPYGLTVAGIAATVAAQSGITVVSGGAKGCDQAAGRAALAAHGKHVIVLGCGADVVYPRSSFSLIDHTLASGGAVVSLDPWGTPPRKYAFPRRNRIIAALSQALCITEASRPSGTFSTAETAIELNREVLAVPGSILSPESRGTNYLIANGACCIEDEDSLEMAISRIYGKLRYTREANVDITDMNPLEQKVLHALIASPMSLNELALFLKLDTMSTLQTMSTFMMRGLVERLLDGRFAPSMEMLHERSTIVQNAASKTKT